ncbi:MAG TPA: lysophospholipid acyltransferase family protein [Gammaproteobacteria bacterium]
MGRSWRFVATLVSFAAFGACALVMGALYFGALLVLMPPGPSRQRLARGGVQWGFRAFLHFMSLVGVVKLDIDRLGLARLGASGRCVIVANHPTLLDAMVLLAYVEGAGCVVKHGLWRNPFLSPAIRASNYIPSRDSEQLLRDCAAALGRNEPLIVFPEATRSVPGEPLKLQRGAATIALDSDVVLEIVHFSCEPVFLSKTQAWYLIPDRRPCLAARVGASVRARDFQGDGLNRNVAARRLTEALQRELAREIPSDARAGAGAETTAH